LIHEFAIMRKWLIVIVASTFSLAACERRTAPEEEVSEQSATGSETAEPAVPASLYGNLVVDADFEEQVLEGQAGGPVRASTFHRNCKGNLSAEPGHVLTVSGDREVTIAARPSTARMADLTLVVRAPDGSWLCVDDADELNPVLELEATDGNYKVWVGAYSEGLNENYRLTVNRGQADLGEIAPSGPDPVATDQGSYGGFRIVEGTGHGTLEGTAGGTREATDISPGCSGYIAMTPDHVLTLEDELTLRLRVESREDTTLVLQGPDDTVHCNDDTDGWNPALRETLPPGVWSVYVGTYAPSKYPDYKLHVSR
jgi:hypothetical protein